MKAVVLPALFVSRFNTNESLVPPGTLSEALFKPFSSVASGSVAPLEGFRIAATLCPCEPLTVNTTLSLAYPPKFKTLTIVTVPALFKYCFAVNGT